MLWRIRWDIFTSFTVYITHDRTETVTSAQHLHNYSKLGILILGLNVSFLLFPWCLNVKTIAEHTFSTFLTRLFTHGYFDCITSVGVHAVQFFVVYVERCVLAYIDLHWLWQNSHIVTVEVCFSVYIVYLHLKSWQYEYNIHARCSRLSPSFKKLVVGKLEIHDYDQIRSFANLYYRLAKLHQLLRIIL